MSDIKLKLLGPSEPALDYAMPCAGKVDEPRKKHPARETLYLQTQLHSELSISANSVTTLSGNYVTNVSPRLNLFLSLCQSVTTAPSEIPVNNTPSENYVTNVSPTLQTEKSMCNYPSSPPTPTSVKFVTIYPQGQVIKR